jgi:phosphoserine phosphatase RsbU/P
MNHRLLVAPARHFAPAPGSTYSLRLLFPGMNARAHTRHLSIADMEAILAVTSKLAAPFDLGSMLAEVVGAAKQVLRAERGSVWLYDPVADQLVLEIATGIAPVRVSASVGLAGACARHRSIINVRDCYADQRFNTDVDRDSGYRTRCMLTLPLVDHKDVLVGVMQVLNKVDGVFDDNDEALATVLAAQCAVALQRVRMTEGLLQGEKMRLELETARAVQLSTLPAIMPSLAGYEVYGASKPADLTGGDTFDLAVDGGRLIVVLADATGHGIAPALSVTQMQAMLRMAFRLGADLDTAFVQANNQLADTLADDRFITAFVGVLDASSHQLRFHSGGQGPILHFHAASGTFASFGPTSFPLGAMHLSSLQPAVVVELQPGDVLMLLSDGIYEQRNDRGEEFGQRRVEDIVRRYGHHGTPQLALHLLDGVQAFAAETAQEDDMTVVLLKRDEAIRTATESAETASRTFTRSFASLEEIFAFTSGVFAAAGIDAALLPTVDLTVEELFTNMVKYGTSSAEVRVELTRIANGVEVTLTDYDVDPFDVTTAPDVDVTLPIEQRNPGGLGLHLIRRLVDRINYEYSVDTRQSRITFRKTQVILPTSNGGDNVGSANAGD